MSPPSSTATSLPRLPKRRFTFGLWTVGNVGRDPFGEPSRKPVPPVALVQGLARVGAYGVNLHDNDLVPIDASARERDAILSTFKAALEDTGLRVPMATTNLFSDKVFKDGAFTSHDRRVRELALAKAMRGIELGVELGAEVYVFWGGREGAETDAGKDPIEAIRRFREAIDFLTEWVTDQGHAIRFALEAKPNEPRGDIYLPTTGAMLGFIATLRNPHLVGVNPEVAHETMAGLSVPHAVAQALEAGKLFHIDLNDQRIGRYDQDFRFGSSDIKSAFMLVKLLEDNGWDGYRHFDAHAYRSEDLDGVWDFARGCIRTYELLQEKAAAFAADREIQALLAEITGADPGGGGPARAATAPLEYSRDRAAALLAANHDRDALARRRLPYERLDQLVVELLMGKR